MHDALWRCQGQHQQTDHRAQSGSLGLATYLLNHRYNSSMYVCLFDIDGTLLASGGAGKAAMEAALTSEFGVRDVNHDVPFSGRTDQAIGRDLLRLHGIPATEKNWQRFL